MQTEPLRGPALRAALAAIIAAPVRDLPPATEDRLAVRYTREQSGRMGAKAASAWKAQRVAKPKRVTKQIGHNHRPDVTNAEVRRVWDTGATLSQMAERFKISRRAISNRLAKLGLSRRPNEKLGREDFAERLATIGDRALAAELGSDLNTIRRRARRMGLIA